MYMHLQIRAHREPSRFFTRNLWWHAKRVRAPYPSAGAPLSDALHGACSMRLNCTFLFCASACLLSLSSATRLEAAKTSTPFSGSICILVPAAKMTLRGFFSSSSLSSTIIGASGASPPRCSNGGTHPASAPWFAWSPTTPGRPGTRGGRFRWMTQYSASWQTARKGSQ